MKKNDLARRLARETSLSKAAAADELDRIVHDILKNLRKGQPAVLPGLGTLTLGRKGVFRFAPQDPRRNPDGKE